MRERQPDAEPARLGQRVGHVGRQVDVVLELVGVDDDRMPPLSRDAGTSEDRLPELGDEQRAQERSCFRPDQPLGERDEHDLALREDLVDAEARARAGRRSPGRSF